jgi:spermidine synthase
MGELSVRRRLEPTLQVDVWEVILNDEHLMSSLFTVAETALASLGLAAVAGDGLDVIVGGLGLGYTACEVLRDPRVASLRVIDALGEVISWHERSLFPFASELNTDTRCAFVHGDFFAMVRDGAPFGADVPTRAHAVLVDIDHTPRHLLHPSHESFYEPGGLQQLADRLHPGGVFGLWSDAPPDAGFIATVKSVFASCVAHVVTFPNFHTDGESANTVYVATTAY